MDVFVIPQILWPIVAFCTAAFSCYGFVRWLGRAQKTVQMLQIELIETQRDWTHKFEQFERTFEARLNAVERRLNAERGANPLGSHYDTRRPG